MTQTGALDAGRPGVLGAARHAQLLTGRQLRIFRARPGRLIYPLVQPVITLVLFEAIFSSLAKVPGASYRQFLVPGLIIENIALTAPGAGVGLVLDASSGLADRFRSLPMARSAPLVGRLASEALILLGESLLLLGTAALLGFRVHDGITGLIGIIAVGVGFGVAVATTTSWLALRLRDPETAQRALYLPMVPVAFVSSAFIPVGRLAGWLQPVARVNPVTPAVDVMRTFADGGAFGREPIYLLAWLVALTFLPGRWAVRRWQQGGATARAGTGEPM